MLPDCRGFEKLKVIYVVMMSKWKVDDGGKGGSEKRMMVEKVKFCCGSELADGENCDR